MNPSLSYSPDIDGLRALAVILVVSYHAGFPWLPGGFVGVDIFFVISGFLITGLLLDERKRTGRMDLRAFWARRIARLAPALLIVVLVTLFLSTIFLSRIGGETGPAAKAALATLAINANHFFLIESGDYFANAAETNPFLHMWSLSVEEQFYLFWPLVLVFLAAASGYKRAAVGIVILMIASLACSYWVSALEAPVGFYAMPPRAWELLAGALLAIAIRSKPIRIEPIPASIVFIAGICLIAAATVGLSAQSSFPFPTALLPVLGAALVILAGHANRENAASRLLGSRWLVYIGLISYPLYLWHWPLLVLARADRLYAESPGMDVAMVLISIALAVGTFEVVERRGRPWFAKGGPVRTMSKGLAASAVLFVLAAGVGAWARFGWGYSDSDRFLAEARMDMERTGCKESYPGSDSFERCYPTSTGQPSLLLWGDSHATHWAAGLVPEVERAGATLGIVARGGCKPLLGAANHCDFVTQRIAGALPDFHDKRNLRGVILSSHWSREMGLISPTYSERRPSARFSFYDDRATSTAQALDLFEAGFANTISAAVSANLRVLVVLPSPVQRFKVPHCLSKTENVDCHVALPEMDLYAGAIESRIRKVIEEYPEVRLLDPKRFLCFDDNCPAVVGDLIAYNDESHLTWTFSKTLGVHFAEDIAWLLHGDAARTTPSVSGGFAFEE